MINIIKGMIIMGMIGMLLGCSGPDLEEYANKTPPMNIKEFFNGKIKAWGIIQNRNGNITNRFDVDMVASWEGDKGTLDEQFHYYDDPKDKKLHRVWHLTQTGPNSFEGQADDVTGKATGKISGNAVNWNYVLQVTVNGSNYEINMNDWMWKMDDKTLFNRVYMRKFGFKVSELTIFMQKQD
jgi:hypothetical protein